MKESAKTETSDTLILAPNGSLAKTASIIKITNKIVEASVEHLFNEAFVLLNGNQIVDTLENFYELFAKTLIVPAHLSPLFFKANSTEDCQKSIQQFSTVILRSQKILFAWYFRGQAWLHLKEYEKAISDFTQSIGIEPNFALGFSARAYAKHYLGLYEEAVIDCDRSIDIGCDRIDIEGKNVYPYLIRGMNYFHLKNYEASIADYEVVLEYKPMMPGYHVGLGQSKRRLGLLGEAVDSFTIAIGIDENYYFAYQQRGLALVSQSDIEAAIADFSMAIRIDPTRSGMHFHRGAAYAKVKSFEEAIKDLSKAIELSPKVSKYYKFRSDAKKALGDFDGAEADLRTYHELKI